MITIGYCSREKTNLFSDIDAEVIPKIGYSSICKAYNEIIKESKNETICLVHDDVKFISPDWEKEIEKIFEDHQDVGIIGVIGSTSFSGKGWFGKGGQSVGCIIQKYKRRKIHPKFIVCSSKLYGSDFVDTVTCDGVFIALRRDRIKCMFDENLDGFHFYDVCFTTDNFLKGVRVGVTYHIKLIHESEGCYDDVWYKERKYIRNKYHKPVRLNGKLKGGRITAIDYGE